MNAPPTTDLAAAAPAARAAAAPRARAPSVRTYLIALVGACVLPALIVSALLIYDAYRLQRERVYREAVQTARTIASGLDRQLVGIEAGLHVLATSRELTQGDLAGFHARAADALRSQMIDNYVMTDARGQQLINTLLPFGAPLPNRGTPPELQKVFDERSTVLTGLFDGAVTHAPTIAMGVPVFRDGEVIYALNIGMRPARINAFVAQQPLPSGWIAAVIDGRGTIVARSRDPDRFVGQPAVEPIMAFLRGRQEGTLETVTKEGIPVFTAIARSNVSDWSIAVGAPRNALTDTLYRSLAWVVIGESIVFGVGLYLAIGLGRRLTSGVRDLVAPALALGAGDAVHVKTSGLREVDDVANALLEAAGKLTAARYQAHHDSLTGLANRLLFDEIARHRIEAARRQGTGLAVLAIDLDGFKAINDRHGHAIGDTLLKAAAERIARTVRACDTAARLGGDEFAVLLDPADGASASIVANKLVAVLSMPYPGVASTLSASIGVALFPQGGEAIDDLLRRADRALYESKRAGKACSTIDVRATVPRIGSTDER